MLIKCKKKSKQRLRSEERRRRKSLRSSVFVSCRNVQLTDRERSMLCVPSVPSRKESARPAEKKKRKPLKLLRTPSTSILPAVNNLLSVRSCSHCRPKLSVTNSSVLLKSRRSKKVRSVKWLRKGKTLSETTLQQFGKLQFWCGVHDAQLG